MIDEQKIREYVKKAHYVASRHGFHDQKHSNERWLCLGISEVMESVEADRKGHRANREAFEREAVKRQMPGHNIEHRRFHFNQFIKDSIEDEIADAAIRIFDFIGELYGDRMVYTFGGASRFAVASFPETAFRFVKEVLGDRMIELSESIEYLYAWAESLNFDLDWHIEWKMRYNVFRPKLHGKSY